MRMGPPVNVREEALQQMLESSVPDVEINRLVCKKEGDLRAFRISPLKMFTQLTMRKTSHLPPY